MDPMSPPEPLAIAGIRLNVADVGRSTTFYEALGFRAAAPGRLTFGAVVLELVAATGSPYPAPAAANDPWFQHFAISVADFAEGFAVALGAGATPISRGGPQHLPANTGGVTAWKFRDPDGHPLELSLLLGSDWLRDAPTGAVFLGVDHTAIAVADLAISVAWYASSGWVETARSRNQGSEQDALDDLPGTVVDIVVLTPPGAGPHLELLCYRTPEPAPPRWIADGDIAATTTLIAHGNAARDPDGHRLAPPLRSSRRTHFRPTARSGDRPMPTIVVNG